MDVSSRTFVFHVEKGASMIYIPINAISRDEEGEGGDRERKRSKNKSVHGLLRLELRNC